MKTGPARLRLVQARSTWWRSTRPIMCCLHGPRTLRVRLSLPSRRWAVRAEMDAHPEAQ